MLGLDVSVTDTSEMVVCACMHVGGHVNCNTSNSMWIWKQLADGLLKFEGKLNTAFKLNTSFSVAFIQKMA